jgi:hypothetical protein
VKWLHLGEYCYNTTHRMSIDMTPFQALYSYDALTFADVVFSDSRVPKPRDWIQDSQDIVRALKENMRVAQDQ